jgi:ubiquitin-protein ligase
MQDVEDFKQTNESNNEKGKKHLHVSIEHSDKNVCLLASKREWKWSFTCKSCIQACQAEITSTCNSTTKLITCNFTSKLQAMQDLQIRQCTHLDRML